MKLITSDSGTPIKQSIYEPYGEVIGTVLDLTSANTAGLTRRQVRQIKRLKAAAERQAERLERIMDAADKAKEVLRFAKIVRLTSSVSLKFLNHEEEASFVSCRAEGFLARSHMAISQ